jgi:hypothetical protein
VNETHGWIKLHRKSLNSIWSNKPLISAFAHYCMKKAYWKPGKIYWLGHERELQPGQFYTGRITLSHETGISQRSVRTCIKFLSKTGFLTSETTNKGSIITLLNYTLYQSDEEIRPAERPASDQQATSKRPASDHRLRSKEVKEVEESKKGKELNSNPLSLTAKNAEPTFDAFWKTYPQRNGKKSGKQLALKQWQILNPNQQLIDEIMNALKKQIDHKRNCDSSKIFCAEFPDAQRWLKHCKWQDEITDTNGGSTHASGLDRIPEM